MARCLKIVLVIVLVTIYSDVWCQSGGKRMEDRRLKRSEAFVELKALLKDKPIVFVAERAFPTGYKNVDLYTNTNYLRIWGDSAFVYMPYFGRAYQITPGERGGFYFDGAIEDKVLNSDDRKREVTMSFVMKNKGDVFQFYLNITSENNASLNISSNNRSSISYHGKVHEWTKDDE